jgi:hypothetical protein
MARRNTQLAMGAAYDAASALEKCGRGITARLHRECMYLQCCYARLGRSHCPRSNQPVRALRGVHLSLLIPFCNSAKPRLYLLLTSTRTLALFSIHPSIHPSTVPACAVVVLCPLRHSETLAKAVLRSFGGRKEKRRLTYPTPYHSHHHHHYFVHHRRPTTQPHNDTERRPNALFTLPG